MQVVKRDGRIVQFDAAKINDAILAAFEDVDQTKSGGYDIAWQIVGHITDVAKKSDKPLGIEQIQDMVEHGLMESDRKDVARAYITYRDMRTHARERTSELMRQIGEKLNATNVVNQNANVDERAFSGRLGEAQSVVAKRYALDNLVSKMARDHHDNNEIYIHDLDSYALGMHNCARGTTWIQLKRGDKVEIRRIGDFANEIGLAQNQTADLSLTNISILARDGWTEFQAMTCRAPQADEQLFVIKTDRDLPLELTADHRLPVIRNGEEVVLEVRDIIVGDELLATDQIAELVPASIKSIETMPLTEDVYDIQTATHWFIANNYVSHNCLTLPIDDLLANGFVTRQTDVRPAGSVKSAMQLVAVLFQLQSLCQFGGVAASHLDWSMVPYIRKSFSKHYRDGMRFIAHDASYERDGSKSIMDATYLANKEVYDYAMAMTEEETKQATEAMFHNLNLGRHGGNVMNIAA